MKRRKWLLVPIPAILVVAIYFGWGSILASKYEARLDALRAAGEPVTVEDLLGPPVPDELNGAALILEAAEIFKKIDAEFCFCLSLYPEFEEGAERPTGDALPLLAPCFDKIEEALRRPVISLPRRGSKTIIEFPRFQDALSALAFKGHFEPTAELVDTHLDLADRLAQRMFLEVVGKFVTLQQAMQILRQGLEGGSIDLESNAGRWRMRLRDAESGDDARVVLRSGRVSQIDLFEQYRRGEDPYKETRETLENFGMDSFQALERPWYSRWYGRPVLYRRALDTLEFLEEKRACVDDEAAMREHTPYFRMALTFRSMFRLARVFLAIKQRGEPLPRLEDYFPDGEMPLDAFTGKPFLYERIGDGIFIAAGKKASRESLIEDLLAWEIRYD